MLKIKLDEAWFTEFKHLFKPDHYLPQNPEEEMLLNHFSSATEPEIQLSATEVEAVLKDDFKDLGIKHFIEDFLEKVVGEAYKATGVITEMETT